MAGKRGNPGGRPTGKEKLARDAFLPHAETFIRTVIEVANDREARDADRLKAAQIGLSYLYGKPTEQQKITLDGGLKELPRINVNVLPKAED